MSKDSGQLAMTPKKFKLGHLGNLNQVITALGKTIRAMADGSLDSQVGARICNGLGIMRSCLETATLDRLGERLDQLESTRESYVPKYDQSHHLLSNDTQAAARKLGLKLHALPASTQRDFDTAFATLAQQQVGALVIGTDGFFVGQSQHLGALTLRHAVPAVFQNREFVAAGGLMSYSGSEIDANRLMGIYTGRILKGEKPADLPVQQSTKVALTINLKTAKALGVTVPLIMQMTADEVIE